MRPIKTIKANPNKGHGAAYGYGARIKAPMSINGFMPDKP
jgi:hypothetical protein